MINYAFNLCVAAVALFAAMLWVLHEPFSAVVLLVIFGAIVGAIFTDHRPRF